MSILKGEAALARKLHAQKETTGRIINRPPSDEYAEGWERVFGKKDEKPYAQVLIRKDGSAETLKRYVPGRRIVRLEKDYKYHVYESAGWDPETRTATYKWAGIDR